MMDGLDTLVAKKTIKGPFEARSENSLSFTFPKVSEITLEMMKRASTWIIGN